MTYKVKIHPVAQKQMLSLPREAQVKLSLSIDHLGNTPRAPRVKKLAESELWRIRVGQYRIVYAIDDEVQLITIVKVARRKEDTCKGL